ncbi:hypothetical protein DNTS_023536 [Danionella cerebrum]|uniref:Ferritin n=1 Tax=Danionella cerebrum TaxID=2873325 RepID=A0A553R7E2_9TELE|nr:hypothetical protein DNTS_023536 [Danionella translucida]
MFSILLQNKFVSEPIHRFPLCMNWSNSSSDPQLFPGFHIRQNYARDCEALINRMINLELNAGYNYTSMAFYFKRDDVALNGFAKFFKKNSEEEREHAEKFMELQNKRGGRIVLQDVKKPERDEWDNGLVAMQSALQLEKTTHYLNEQVEAIKKLGDHITNLSKMDAGNNKMAEYLFDKHTLDGDS